jgi:hypothetical protein
LVPTTTGGYDYVAYDCLQSCGVPSGEFNSKIRLQNAYHCLHAATLHQGTIPSPITFRTKSIFALTDMVRFLRDYLPSLPYNKDGLIFTAVDAPAIPGQARMLINGEVNNTIYKYKRGRANTGDPVLLLENGVMRMFYQDGENTFRLYDVLSDPFVRFLRTLVCMRTNPT